MSIELRHMGSFVPVLEPGSYNFVFLKKIVMIRTIKILDAKN